MPYRLYKGVFSVRCRQPKCPYNDQIKIDQDIVGVTEEDVRVEAFKMARDHATMKHDSVFGRRTHGLESPEIRMVSGAIQKLGGASLAGTADHKGISVRTFGKGEVILRKGETAGTVCEILEGGAYPLANKSHRYGVGDCFGVAALVPHHTRLSDVIAQADGTSVAFYDLNDLRQNEPGRASRVVSRIMEDTLQVVDELGKTVDRLRKGRHKIAS
jgi:hypothetical protein